MISRRDKGGVLIVVMIMAVVIAGFCITSLLVSHSESQGTYVSILRDQALFVASAGVEDEVNDLKDLMSATGLVEPFAPFHALAGTTVIEARPLISNGMQVGEYSVRIDSVTASGTWDRDVSITAVGFVPSATDPRAVSRTVTAVVRVGVGRSEVFDYVYFINNWGWYYGDTIYASGNVRANGQFDFGHYRPHVNGISRFVELGEGKFGDLIDRGGIYAGWDIVNADRVSGSASKDEFQHTFQDQLPMPNLSDLSSYEAAAKAAGASISIGGKAMCDAVVGDEPGEKPNLYLKGTAANPIVLNGSVVVRGNLLISGVIRGKGSIYCNGNVYVTGNLSYETGIKPIEQGDSAAALEQWIENNEEADALGLFAREHVVVGNYTASSWQNYVKQWVYDWRNRSDEDAGEDGIPNTRAGRDGMMGTADDDVLESDGKWTVERYTQAMAEAGRIPAGYSVGDAIPETGEDIDGDGKYDPGTRMSDFNVNVPLNAIYWEGNFPGGGTKSFTDLCENGGLKITRLDAAFYTNHTFAMLTLDGTKDLDINGCVVSRNESIVYGTKKLNINYDVRLLLSDNPHGLNLPKTWKPLTMVMWRSN